MVFTYRDQIGSTVCLAERPQRIISLVPSQSELLWDLGLRNELVGITKFCIHPEQMHRSVERVGGTKKLDLEKIRNLKPDLIIGNKEENEKEQIEALQKEFPVWLSDIYTFEDSFKMITLLGDLLGRNTEAESTIKRLRNSLEKTKSRFKDENTAYFIWYKPYMLAGANTFIDHVLNHVGLKNAVSHLQRYPEVTAETLKRINPSICLLSSEPFPFKENHIGELQKLLPASEIVICDGEVFSWYGTRLLHLEDYVEKLDGMINHREPREE